MVTAGELYDGDEPEVEEPKEEPTGEVETEVKVDSEEETKTEVEPEEQVASPAPESETQVPISAMHGERDRRQAAERELSTLRAQLDETNKTEPTSVFEDEAKFRDEVSSDFNQQLTNHSLNQSEFFASREVGRDVLDQKIEVFKGLADSNPQLAQQFANAVSPYHELISIVDKHNEIEQMKDLDAYKANLKAEVTAEVKKELTAEKEKRDAVINSIPDSLVGDTSAGGLNSSVSFEEPTAEDLYNN